MILDHRQPDVCAAVVGRTAQDAGVDDAAPGLDEAGPVQPGVRADDHVRLRIAQQLADERRRCRALPQELVDLSRRAVAEKDAAAGDRQPDVTRKRPHPGLVLGARASPRIVVGELREVVVARVRVAAVTVVGVRGQRFLVVALDGGDARLTQDLQGAVHLVGRLWARLRYTYLEGEGAKP